MAAGGIFKQEIALTPFCNQITAGIYAEQQVNYLDNTVSFWDDTNSTAEAYKISTSAVLAHICLFTLVYQYLTMN